MRVMPSHQRMACSLVSKVGSSQDFEHVAARPPAAVVYLLGVGVHAALMVYEEVVVWVGGVEGLPAERGGVGFRREGFDCHTGGEG